MIWPFSWASYWALSRRSLLPIGLVCLLAPKTELKTSASKNIQHPIVTIDSSVLVRILPIDLRSFTSLAPRLELII